MSGHAADKIELGKPQFASHSWLEPIIVVSIMISSLIINRHRALKILSKNQHPTIKVSEPEDVEASPTSSQGQISEKNPPKRRVYGFLAINTPNSSRFARHLHSRVLQKFPFLVEMFYWILNYLFYSCTKVISQHLSPAGRDVVQLAQDHAIGILDFEHHAGFNFVFPIEDFISWYYWAAPDFEKFAVVRRTMTLGNFIAFLVFCFFPCMPPRLLPESFNFHDTVRQEHAESVWVGGKMVNQLAAMPSLHFTYAFVIGATLIYHSGLGVNCLSRKRTTGSLLTTTLFFVLGIVYPLLVLSVIVATANHYWLDAVAAMISVAFSFYINRIWFILLPLEDLFLWVLRLEKPVPTTGMRHFGAARQARSDHADEELEGLLNRSM
ncbi:hypothetical protein ARAM_001561 [Aspergillus rambellii]|uniref:Inositolphosphotransferase Aur1/Ipt1 domain-containing protein n=1 Tax=Aspergillus rambellii TaxID=308745 RepID=A0A0F8VSU3_9EURO|nr:hypothetical protein ARAM_001561 [Aspergillus rambellii]